MAKLSKSTTSTPKAKSSVLTPKSAPAIPAVHPMSSPSSSTPARKQTKRKATQDDDVVDNVAATTTATSSSNSSIKTKKPKVSVHTEQSVLASTTASGKKASHKHRNVRIEIPASSLSTPAKKGNHIVFDNNDDDVNNDVDEDGPSEFFTPQEDVKTNPLEAQLSNEAEAEIEADSERETDDDDDDDDDDDAPEAVSTSTAAAQVAKATQAAARAAELQQDEERRKRQERDARFKKQAEARKKQQQQQQQEASTAGKENEEEDDDAESDDSAPAKPQPKARLVTSLATSSRKRLDRRNLPAVLPDEFLASDSEEDDAEEDSDEDQQRKGGSSSGRGRRRKTGPKKITFNTAARQVAKAEPRHPADQRVGATVYRVMKKQGEAKLAPRGGKYSKNAKEMLLGRGRVVPKTGLKKKGFLVVR